MACNFQTLSSSAFSLKNLSYVGIHFQMIIKVISIGSVNGFVSHKNQTITWINHRCPMDSHHELSVMRSTLSFNDPIRDCDLYSTFCHQRRSFITLHIISIFNITCIESSITVWHVSMWNQQRQIRKVCVTWTLIEDMWRNNNYCRSRVTWFIP